MFRVAFGRAPPARAAWLLPRLWIFLLKGLGPGSPRNLFSLCTTRQRKAAPLTRAADREPRASGERVLWTGDALKDEEIKTVRRSGFPSDRTYRPGARRHLFSGEDVQHPRLLGISIEEDGYLENACADFQTLLPGILQTYAQN